MELKFKKLFKSNTLIVETFARETFANFAILGLFRESLSREKFEIVHSRKFISRNFSKTPKTCELALKLSKHGVKTLFYKFQKGSFAKVYLAKFFAFLNSRKFIQKISRVFYLAKVSLAKVSPIKVYISTFKFTY